MKVVNATAAAQLVWTYLCLRVQEPPGKFHKNAFSASVFNI